MSRLDRIFSLKPSLHDRRDFKHTISSLKLEPYVDLRMWDSPIEDQGSIGSCASHAVTSAYENQLRAFYPDRYDELSRLFLYYHTRVIERTISRDSGVVYLRSVMKAGNKYGLCKEQFWPYSADLLTEQPTPDSYSDASHRRIIEYSSIESISGIIDSVMLGKPVVIGFELFDSFMNMTKDRPIVQLPEVTENAVGGHAVVIVGYHLNSRHFIIKNSFGATWGDQGYAYMPFDYVKLHVFDKWTFDIHDPDTCIVPDVLDKWIPLLDSNQH